MGLVSGVSVDEHRADIAHVIVGSVVHYNSRCRQLVVPACGNYLSVPFHGQCVVIVPPLDRQHFCVHAVQPREFVGDICYRSEIDHMAAYHRYQYHVMAAVSLYHGYQRAPGGVGFDIVYQRQQCRRLENAVERAGYDGYIGVIPGVGRDAFAFAVYVV